MVVRLGGTTDRPDGCTYHITWSLEDGRQAKESNARARGRGWVEFDLTDAAHRSSPARWP